MMVENLSAEIKKMGELMFTKEEQLKKVGIHCHELEKVVQKSESELDEELEEKNNKIRLLEENITHKSE